MSKWETKIYRLTELGSVSRGRSRHRPRDDKSLYGGKYPFIQTGDVKSANFYLSSFTQTYNEIGLVQSKLWKAGTLCITIAANIAETAILSIDACFPDSIVGFTPYEGISDVRYVKYYFDIYKKQMQAMSLGATQDNFSVEKMLRVKFVFPDYPTQTRIAEILSAYDDAIENNNRRIVLLEKAVRELYREWFVRFRFPGHENAKFVNGMPEGWQVASFGSLADIIDGDRGANYPKQDEFSPDGFCLFLNAGNVTKNGFDFGDNAFITEDKDRILRKGRLARNDIVLTTRGTVGNVAFFNKHIPYEVMRINSGMVILRDSSEVSPEFLYITLRSDAVQKMIELYSSGSAQPQLPIKDMRKMKIIRPTDELLSKFTDIVGDILNQSALLQTQSQNLAHQRDLLLPRLMSGKLEV